ncbi:MAG: ABC transporter permease [Methanosarcina sp.]|jgi:ABC-2 type transport system permease protein|nr:ABC transporter permease [Methanosarcina sp.]MDD4523828.1 ABC transporter permease [Methanosarcina sp.]
MNFSEIHIIGEDETFRGSKSKYVWLFGGIFIFLCFLAMHYSTSYISFLFSNSGGIPYTLISYLVVLSIGPFMVMITSFDIVSSETETGSLRYIISKAHRSSFVLGKFSFLFLVFTSMSFGVALISLIYQYSTSNTFQFEKIVLFLISSSLYLGCFISIFLFISILSANNKISFAMSAVFLGILIFFFLQGDESYLKYFTPYYYGIKNIEFMKSFPVEAGYLKIFESLCSMLLYMLVFLFMSLAAINRRDL